MAFIPDPCFLDVHSATTTEEEKPLNHPSTPTATMTASDELFNGVVKATRTCPEQAGTCSHKMQKKKKRILDSKRLHDLSEKHFDPEIDRQPTPHGIVRIVDQEGFQPWYSLSSHAGAFSVPGRSMITNILRHNPSKLPLNEEQLRRFLPKDSSGLRQV